MERRWEKSKLVRCGKQQVRMLLGSLLPLLKSGLQWLLAADRQRMCLTNLSAAEWRTFSKTSVISCFLNRSLKNLKRDKPKSCSLFLYQFYSFHAIIWTCLKTEYMLQTWNLWTLDTQVNKYYFYIVFSMLVKIYLPTQC